MWPLAVPAQMEFRWDQVLQRSDLLLAGLRYTIFIASVAMALALVLGLVIALMRRSRFRPVAVLAAVYVNVFRAIPLLVLYLVVVYLVAWGWRWLERRLDIRRAQPRRGVELAGPGQARPAVPSH